MTFDLIPGNREILAILADHVQGPYHFVHDALKPYVQVQPTEPGQSIVVTSSPRLQLLRRATSRQVSDTMTFVIMFQAGGTQLVEVLPLKPAGRAVGLPRALHLGDVQAEMVPEGGHPAPPPKPRAKRITVTPEPVMPPPPPVEIPRAYHALCTTHDVHPELGDYLVVPSLHSLPPPMPPWVIRTPSVSVMHLVKPRLRTDDILEGV